MLYLFHIRDLIFCIVKRFLFILIVFVFGNYVAQSQPTDSISIHDPSAIKVRGGYHVFGTGFGITHLYSDDLKTWKRRKPVFSKSPEWARSVVPRFRNHIWAPDISFFNGKYYLYYSVSAFGKNTSAIGLVTNPTLDEDDPDYEWVDYGIVVRSIPGRDTWNAIDPNLILDGVGDPWLTFGSFWDGIKLVKLNEKADAIDSSQQWFTIASRKRDFGISDTLPGNAAIEAPYIFHHDDYYYLFVSYDYCCRGVKSTYKIMVGRAKSITGPYVDKEDKLMTEGGASLVLKGNERYHGLGHNGILDEGDKQYLIFHAYDAHDSGKSKLKILPIIWDDGWPIIDSLK